MFKLFVNNIVYNIVYNIVNNDGLCYDGARLYIVKTSFPSGKEMPFFNKFYFLHTTVELYVHR